MPSASPEIPHDHGRPREVIQADDVLLVPAGALFREGREWATFVREDGRARLRLVELGPSDGRTAEVRAGLAEGEEVVLHPSDRVEDGTRVEPRTPA